MLENRRSKDKRYYFSRGQMILLGAGIVAGSVIFFLLGMVVGKTLEERKIVKAEEPLIKVPVKPATPSGATAGGLQSKDELTFYDALTKPSGGAPLSEDKPKEIKNPEKSVKSERSDTPAKPDPALVVAKKRPEKSAEKPAAKAAPSKLPEKSPPPEPTAAVDDAAKRNSAETADNGKEQGKWMVQVNAFPDEQSAKIWVDKLRSKGYNAYIAETRNKGRTWYRVRVGPYTSRDDAAKAELALRTNENLSTFITVR